ncbi:hypothetical protein NP233_g1198 [Leucocoprinus birnbaumii]|uniref:Pali-domain-containing protein n=1 Tax=Leucocoprinus birnbaumii TaxID=56174 RepID=A0AAD5W2P6_9AGAR|nr:hypothetical protein NP233_g1198 [Leucocoprinus birnbaumii]
MVRPLQEYRIISIVACTFLLTSCILLLLVGLSLPIIKSIYIIKVQSTANIGPPTTVATQLRFGVWGVCAYSDLEQPTPLGENGLCFGPMLGYVVPPEITSLIGLSPDIINAVEVSLRVILVLHPVAAGLALITFFTSLFLASHAVSIFTLFLAVVAALLATVVFGIDLALVLIVKNALKNLLNLNLKFDVAFGGGVWMVLVGVILLWTSVCLLSARACYCCGISRKPVKQVF